MISIFSGIIAEGVRGTITGVLRCVEELALLYITVCDTLKYIFFFYGNDCDDTMQTAADGTLHTTPIHQRRCAVYGKQHSSELWGGQGRGALFWMDPLLLA